MSSRAKRRLQQLRSSLWPLPVLAIALGTCVGLALPQLDERGFLHELLASVPILAPVLEVEGSSAQSRTRRGCRSCGRPGRATTRKATVPSSDARTTCEVRSPRKRRLEARVGDFIIPGLPLLQIWPGEAVDEHCQGRLRRAFVLAQQRTLEQDVLFGVRQLVDVGMKALSAAINDVTTAVMAVNELGLVLQAFQERGPIVEDGWRRERRGHCTMDVPILGLRSMLRHSFDEVARGAGSQLRVSARMLEVMEQVIEATRPDAAQRAAYSQAAKWIESSARLDGATSVEREYFDERYRSLLRRAAGITLPDEEPALH